MSAFPAIESRAFSHLNKRLGLAVDEIIKEIKEELRNQGHNLTGKLSNSITQNIKERARDLIAEVDMLRYGAYQNEGIKPSKIPFARNSNGMPGRRSQFITALQEWVKKRGMSSNDKVALGIAFAIAKKMKKEGMPTRGAKAFSRNGRRRGFLNVPVVRGTGRLTRSVADASKEYVEELLTGVLVGLDQDYESIEA